MKAAVVLMSIILALFVTSVVFAGTNVECPYPYSVVIDGDLDDWAGMTFIFVPYDKGTTPASDDSDASLEFSVVADDDWLYVAIDVKDDAIINGETDDWQDDSVEVYVDANHARTEEYEGDDAQITVASANIGGDINNPILTGSGNIGDTGAIAAVVQTADGWIVEAAVPLSNALWNIDPTPGTVIGFNVHFNDDDDGEGRDHKLIWSDLDTDDASWGNPTRFADLTFVEYAGLAAVRPSGKLAVTWGGIK